jgi:hypothetical protein
MLAQLPIIGCYNFNLLARFLTLRTAGDILEIAGSHVKIFSIDASTPANV